MNILGFLNEHFKLSQSAKKMAKPVSEVVSGDFYFRNNYIIKKTSDDLKNEIITQAEIAQSAGLSSPGSIELIDELSRMMPRTTINMRFIDNSAWDGRVYYDEDNNFVGFIIGRKKHPGWTTPPDWDGSEQMLKTHNINDNE